MQERPNGRDLTSGSVPRHLTRLTAPLAVGIFAVMSVGVVDAYFIGKLGSTELAAMGFVFPVTTALTSLGIGLSAGANALVSQALGAGKEARARRFSAHVIGLSTLLAVLAAVAIAFGQQALFGLLGAEGEVLDAIGEYMRVWALGFPLVVLLLVANALVRAQGSTLVVSGVMVLNALFNGGLDPVLIDGWGPLPSLGIAGAAWASVVAFGISCVVMAWPVLRTYRVVTLGDFVASGYLESARGLARIGPQAALANALNPAGLALATSIVSRLGDDAVAGFGAAGRIESFVMVPLLGLSGSISPFVGQNWGAGEERRAARGVMQSGIFCIGYGVVMAALLTLLAPWIAARFSDSASVQEVTVLYLRIASWSFCGYGIVVVVNSALNARSRAAMSLSLSAARTALLYLPLAAVGAHLAGETGAFTGILIANLAAAALAAWLARREGLAGLGCLRE